MSSGRSRPVLNQTSLSRSGSTNLSQIGQWAGLSRNSRPRLLMITSRPFAETIDAHRHDLDGPTRARSTSRLLSPRHSPGGLRLQRHCPEGLGYAFLIELLGSLGQFVAGHVPVF